ncbi:MAG TPA: hypothetical protein VIJ93_00575, partial [bacterium]
THPIVSPKGEVIVTLNDKLLKYGMDQVLRVFCHEMVHVKQLIVGELGTKKGWFGKNPAIVWKGNEYPMEMVSFAYSVDSLATTLPWELEAYAIDCTLAQKVLDTRKPK